MGTAFLVFLIVVSGLLWSERSKTFAALGEETHQRRLAELEREEADRQREEAQNNLSLARRAIDTLNHQVTAYWEGQVAVENVSKQAMYDSLAEFYEEFAQKAGRTHERRYDRAEALLQAANLAEAIGEDHRARAAWNKSIPRKPNW